MTKTIGNLALARERGVDHDPRPAPLVQLARTRSAPVAPLLSLDQLWFQVSGTDKVFLRAMVWWGDQPEPTDWQLSATDTTAPRKRAWWRRNSSE